MSSRPPRRLFDALGTDRPVGLWRRLLGGAAVLVALAVVFVSYLNPHLALDLATRVWACF